MPDPQLEEFCRANELRPDVFRRLQRHVRDSVQPRLDGYDQLVLENAELREKLQKAVKRPVSA